MERTKVAFIITKLQLGGAQKSVLYSAANLDKNTFESHLLCGKGGYLDGQAQQQIKNLYFINSLVRELSVIKDFCAFLQILKTLLKIKPDIVHTNSSKAGILGRIAAKMLRTKIVHTVHGFSFNDYQPAPLKFFYMQVERFCNKFTDTLIFVSQENLQKALSLNLAVKQQCLLIRAGAELKTKADFTLKDAQKTRKNLGINDGDKIILSTANLKPQKNVFDMIRAAKTVCKKYTAAKFLFTGEGPLKEQALEMIAANNLQNNFLLLGHRDDIAQLLNIADVFALSSLWEGLPMAIAEALAMDIPCVCYDTDGVKEIIKDAQNGYLVRRGKYDILAQKIIDVLEGGLNFTRGDITDFDINTMVKKQEGLYTSLSHLNRR